MFPSRKTHVDSSMDEVTSTELCADGCNWNLRSVEVEQPTPTNTLEEEVSTLPLERCMRIMPHDQNTGAFFIAVFHKLSNPSFNHKDLVEKSTAEIKDASKGVEAESADIGGIQLPEGTKDADLLDKETDDAAFYNNSVKTSQENEVDDDVHPSNYTSVSPKMAGRKRKLQTQGKRRGVDPVIFYRENEVTNKIRDFYGIKETFPFDGHLITRNSDVNNVKRIYYVSKSVKEVLELNFLAKQQLKIASVGLKMFERQTSKDGASAPCAFCISSEGVPLLLPHITKQVLCTSLVDFKHLLQYKNIKFADFVDSNTGGKASNLSLGCCVVVLDNTDQKTAIACWRGTSISVMVSSLECQELLERMSKYTRAELMPSLHGITQSFVEAEDQTRDAPESTENSESPIV
ncbi:unnamed protein product [Cuscuta campestris]|uniref:SAM-dependent MTase RsmB/NOP-type domain-containing protein n=1 Tax=Cuscuta campestris TaxID=132261 RepID=A0A484NEF6_9ASTE|nr:unnamed protein product [Cuscuta campestris]